MIQIQNPHKKYTLDGFPKEDDDLNEEGEAIVRNEITKIFESIDFMDRFRECPICKSPIVCVEQKGSGLRYVCGNRHIISIDEVSLNT